VVTGAKTAKFSVEVELFFSSSFLSVVGEGVSGSGRR
jgi:hypothetical protein